MANPDSSVVQKNIPKSDSPAKTSKNVSILTSMLSPDPFPPTTSNSSAMKIPDPQVPDPLASLVEIKDFGQPPLKKRKKKEMREKKKENTRKGRGENDTMLLNQEQMEVPKWNSPVISCAVQV
jgi:hypothetical protein